MKLTIHPEAAKNCNTKAEDLLGRLQPTPERFSRKRGPGKLRAMRTVRQAFILMVQ